MKLFKPALAFVLLGCHVYAGCSDDEVDPARPRTDAGASADGGTPKPDAAGGTDSATPTPDSSTPTDSSTPPQDSGPKDTGTDVKDATTDGATDAPTDGALDAKQALCTSYCTCMTATCPSELPANCQTTCEAQTNWDLNCRNTHCGLAAVDTTDAGVMTHCGHAVGIGLCPNTL
jgi:hypothetical protein